ncbi:hypothetical protein LTR72_012365, partial [Exophiala xenobiotica]
GQLLSFRLTCGKFARVAAVAAFRTCTTSFLHLSRLASIADNGKLRGHVQEITFHELDFALEPLPELEAQRDLLVSIIVDHLDSNLEDCSLSLQTYTPRGINFSNLLNLTNNSRSFLENFQS